MRAVKKDNAFPQGSHSAGLTKREFYAAIAMHAELVTAGVPGEAADAFIEGKMREGHTVEQHLAFNAFNVADAMCAEAERRSLPVKGDEKC